MSESRTEFEAWICSTGRQHMIERTKMGWYVDLTITALWTAWQAALAQPERVALSDAELRIEHKGCQPHGIRDKRGFLLFFPAIVKYYDQEARYREEIEQQNMLANFLLKSLAAQADPIPANSLELESERDIFPSLGSTWLHTNGSTYTVMHCANRDSDRADYPPTVVYHNTHGKIFAKPLATWYRSRTLVDVSQAITQPVMAEAAPDDAAWDVVNQLREWFAAQRNAISKGCGSTWDMLQCDEQIDLINAAIAARDEPHSQAAMPAKLRALSKHMARIAVEMDYFGGFAEFAKHGSELMGAAGVVGNWASECNASKEAQ